MLLLLRVAAWKTALKLPLSTSNHTELLKQGNSFREIISGLSTLTNTALDFEMLSNLLKTLCSQRCKRLKLQLDVMKNFAKP
jgi:hypothetical protein